MLGRHERGVNQEVVLWRACLLNTSAGFRTIALKRVSAFRQYGDVATGAAR